MTANVYCDFEQPVLKVSTNLVLIQDGIGQDKDFLSGILGFSEIIKNGAGKAVNRVVICEH
jgi:hypothetical protein